MTERERQVAEACRIRREIEQLFVDANYWNERVRKPEESPINPDPDGSLAWWLVSLETFINSDGRVDCEREN